MSGISSDGLTKRYGGRIVVDRLTIGVERGVICGLLGPNGAGKTTALRLMLGLIRPDAGRVEIDGVRVVHGGSRHLHGVGYAPEEPVFYEWMAGREYLDFVGRLHGLAAREREARSRELLEQFDLAGAAGRIQDYSKGMRQRLGVAQALVNRPKVLILDEPAAGIDPLGQRELFRTIAEIGREAAVLVSTHLLADAEAICDRVAVLDHGRLLVESAMDELKRRHMRPLVRFRVRGPSEGLAAAIADLGCVESVVRDGDTFDVKALDLDAAQREIPGVVHGHKLSLLRFEVADLELEDIFAELIRAGRSHA